MESVLLGTWNQLDLLLVLSTITDGFREPMLAPQLKSTRITGERAARIITRGALDDVMQGTQIRASLLMAAEQNAGVLRWHGLSRPGRREGAGAHQAEMSLAQHFDAQILLIRELFKQQSAQNDLQMNKHFQVQQIAAGAEDARLEKSVVQLVTRHVGKVIEELDRVKYGFLDLGDEQDALKDKVDGWCQTFTGVVNDLCELEAAKLRSTAITTRPPTLARPALNAVEDAANHRREVPSALNKARNPAESALNPKTNAAHPPVLARTHEDPAATAADSTTTVASKLDDAQRKRSRLSDGDAAMLQDNGGGAPNPTASTRRSDLASQPFPELDELGEDKHGEMQDGHDDAGNGKLDVAAEDTSDEDDSANCPSYDLHARAGCLLLSRPKRTGKSMRPPTKFLETIPS